MNNRDIAYYGLTDTFNKLYAESKENKIQKHLMKLVSSKRNILLAIKTISSNEGRNTKGTDNISFNDIMKQPEKELIEIIRNKIKWKSPDINRITKIPKKNGKKRKLGIGTIIDRITQQCYLNILNPIVEGQFSPNSFGFRPNSTTKHAFAKAVNGLWKSNRPQYVIDIDLSSYFDTIPIELVLDKLRENFHIQDTLLLRNIKRLIWINSNDGIGVPQGSVLGPLLSNVLLDDLDRILDKLIEKLPDKYTKGMWKAIDRGNWDDVRQGTPYLRYSRYADDIRITTSTLTQVYEILGIIGNWCKQHGIELNREKTHYYNTKDKPVVEMVGFRGKKGPNGLIITPSDQKRILGILRNKVAECKITHNPSALIGTFITLMSYYDICTNNNWMIKYIEGVLNNPKRSGFKIENTLTVNNNNERCYTIKTPNRDGCITFQPWTIRNQTKTSISRYLSKPFIENFNNTTNRIDCGEFLKCCENDHNARMIMYLPGLLHRQKFNCYVTGQPLTPGYVDIHHKKPLYKNGSDNFTNLVLVSRDVHQYLHGLKSGLNLYEDNIKYQKLKSLL